MAYTVNLTDGSIFATVTDGTVNTDSNLTLIGKNYAGYGEFLGENFIRLLENGANNVAPSSPLVGQIWFDKSASILKVYNGITWKEIGSSNSSATAPANPVSGDLWFDSAANQLKVYDGSSWLIIGPQYTAGTGTSGAIVEVVTDTATNEHTVVKVYSEDRVVGIWSGDAEFTPATTIPGFATVKPGMQVSATIADALVHGTATNAQLLDSLDSTQFLRSDANDVTTGTLGIINDSGLTVGADSDLSVSVSGNHVTIKNITSNGDIIFGVNDGGVQKSVITLDGETGLALLHEDPVATMGIATKNYVDSATGGATTTSLARDGSNTITGNLTADSNDIRDFGSSGIRFATIYATTFDGVATTAQYADIAERFAADAVYVPGTVVQIGGTEEVTKVQNELSENVFGVVSANPAYLMNNEAGNNDTHPPIALSGRTPVLVVGKIYKGQRLVSAGNGYARGADANEINAFNVIGRALENKTTEDEGVIEAVVKIC